MSGPMDAWTTDAVRPFVDDALELFGPDRLMYGGDWPIADLAGGYARTWATLTEILGELPSAERDAVFEGTAQRVYGLDATRLAAAVG